MWEHAGVSRLRWAKISRREWEMYIDNSLNDVGCGTGHRLPLPCALVGVGWSSARVELWLLKPGGQAGWDGRP